MSVNSQEKSIWIREAEKNEGMLNVYLEIENFSILIVEIK